MHSSTPAHVGPQAPTAGPVSLVQGVYGARGNLELLACDVADGLWVFWFNADLDTDPLTTPDVPPGQWSAGLHFAGGHRFTEAQILQSTLGPDHLEVLALDEAAVLQHWCWMPGPGFQRRTTDAATGVTRFAAAHDAGTLRLTVEDAAGALRHLVSPPEGYPERRWLLSGDGPELVDPAGAESLILSAGVASDDLQPGTARVTGSRRHGGTRELTWRSATGGIQHLGIPA